MYSETCIERSPSEDGFHRIGVILKTMKNAILCRNWSLCFSDFFTCNDLKIGAFMYSETCIERSPSEDGVPQNRVILKTMKNAILCRNWSLYVQKLVKNISNINFKRELWIKFFLKKTILSFNWVLLINVIVHYRWKTVKVTTTT